MGRKRQRTKVGRKRERELRWAERERTKVGRKREREN